MEKEIIKIPFEGKEIVADIIPKGLKPEVIFLHGAGISSRQIFNKFRELLAKNDITSCAFDFIGYGETPGNVEDSSLENRTNQAKAVIEACSFKTPLSIIAGSMGGYNAIKLTEVFPIKTLVLSAPAVYTVSAYKTNFGEKFSSIIREKQSWNNTDAWGILKKYKGRLLILEGGKDEVIPKDVINSIYNSSENAEYRELLTISNAPHRLASYLQENPEVLDQVVQKILPLLK